jgi:hypothetical protein
MTTGQKVAAVGVVAVAIAAVAIFVSRGAGDEQKELTLATGTGGCTVTTAPADKNLHVGKNHKITYTVKNNCSSDQLLLVGNFRPTQGDNGVTDCKAGVIESTWPFKNLDQSIRQVYIPAGETQHLSLKEAKNETGNTLTFYFDICMGGKKADPRLDIDP